MADLPDGVYSLPFGLTYEWEINLDEDLDERVYGSVPHRDEVWDAAVSHLREETVERFLAEAEKVKQAEFEQLVRDIIRDSYIELWPDGTLTLNALDHRLGVKFTGVPPYEGADGRWVPVCVANEVKCGNKDEL